MSMVVSCHRSCHKRNNSFLEFARNKGVIFSFSTRVKKLVTFDCGVYTRPIVFNLAYLPGLKVEGALLLLASEEPSYAPCYENEAFTNRGVSCFL